MGCNCVNDFTNIVQYESHLYGPIFMHSLFQIWKKIDAHRNYTTVFIDGFSVNPLKFLASSSSSSFPLAPLSEFPFGQSHANIPNGVCRKRLFKHQRKLLRSPVESRKAVQTRAEMYEAIGRKEMISAEFATQEVPRIIFHSAQSDIRGSPHPRPVQPKGDVFQLCPL